MDRPLLRGTKIKSALIYSITNQKGGPGKTTTTLHIGIALSKKGKKVLIIDADPQKNSSTFLLKDPVEFYDKNKSNSFNKSLGATIIDRKPLQIIETRYPNLWLVPSHLDMSTTDIDLMSAHGNRGDRLKIKLDEVKNNYDYILIDTPPALNFLSINAFVSSDYLIVVVEPDLFSLEGIPTLSDTIKVIIKGEYGHIIEFKGILMNKIDKRNSKSLEMLQEELKKSGLKTYKTYLPWRVAISNEKLAFLQTGKPMLSMYDLPRNIYAENVERFILEEFNLPISPKYL